MTHPIDPDQPLASRGPSDETLKRWTRWWLTWPFWLFGVFALVDYIVYVVRLAGTRF